MRFRVRWIPLLFVCSVLACAGPCIYVQKTAARIRAVGGKLQFSGDGASELLGRWGSCGVVFEGPQVGDYDLLRLKEDLEVVVELELRGLSQHRSDR